VWRNVCHPRCSGRTQSIVRRVNGRDPPYRSGTAAQLQRNTWDMRPDNIQPDGCSPAESGLHESFSPEEFRSRTIWSLSNAFTSAFKEPEPIPQFKGNGKIGRVSGDSVLPVALVAGRHRPGRPFSPASCEEICLMRPVLDRFAHGSTQRWTNRQFLVRLLLTSSSRKLLFALFRTIPCMGMSRRAR